MGPLLEIKENTEKWEGFYIPTACPNEIQCRGIKPLPQLSGARHADKRQPYIFKPRLFARIEHKGHRDDFSQALCFVIYVFLCGYISG